MHSFVENLSVSKDDGRWLTLRIRMKKSEFRSDFILQDKDIEYLYENGLGVVREQALSLFRNSLLSNHEENWFRSKTAKGNPVFVAQNATATCCRTCIAKWHDISADNDFTDEEIFYLVDIVMLYICDNIPQDVPDHKQLNLF